MTLNLNSRLHFTQLESKCTWVSEPWPPQGFLDTDLQGMQAQTCATFSAWANWKTGKYSNATEVKM